MRSLLALVALYACGDNAAPAGESLAAGSDLVIVAHQDDDLYFMQPDLLEAVQSGRGITSVYVTAGDDQHGPSAADIRYEGLRYSYGAAAGSLDWRCGFILIDGHVAQHCRLEDRPVSLLFLGYPDGGVNGEFSHSLLKLWDGEITSAETVAHETTSYTQSELVDTIAEIVRETRPTMIHTLEVASTHGHDHVDHMIVGALALLAMARAQSKADLISYRGYSMLDEAPNKLPALLDATSSMVAYYEACSAKCAACGSVCDSIDPAHVAWFARRYAVGFRGHASGRLQTDNGCLKSDLTLGACGSSPSWKLDGGMLHLDDRCLETDERGVLSLSSCVDDPAHRFSLDDEGHIWSAVVPLAQPVMDYAHASCLAATDTSVGTRLCGRDQGAPSWMFAPIVVSTSRAVVALPSFGRDIRLGDIDGDGHADLCAIENAMLVCASGDGVGGFVGPATARFSLAVEPASLVLGDLDNDGHTDACGNDGARIDCALAANAFTVAPWSAAVPPGLSAAAVDGYVCDLNVDAVVCTSPMISRTLSTWPAARTALWPAELDGDGQPDWCAASASGLACSVAAEASLSTDGGQWSFSVAGTVDGGTLLDPGVGTGDIDADGRDDLCAIDGNSVKCARSQGRGFGPRLEVGTFSAPPVALWMGDLDGDGRADICVDSRTTIDCLVGP